jgi:hypothetical protein
MSYVEAADASGEIDVAIAVYIFEPGIFGFGYVDGSSVRESTRDGFIPAL